MLAYWAQVMHGLSPAHADSLRGVAFVAAIVNVEGDPCQGLLFVEVDGDDVGLVVIALPVGFKLGWGESTERRHGESVLLGRVLCIARVCMYIVVK